MGVGSCRRDGQLCICKWDRTCARSELHARDGVDRSRELPHPESAIRYLAFGIIANGPENVLYVGRNNLHLGGTVSLGADWPVMIADWSVPKWLSWVGLIVAGGLALFGFRFTANYEP